MTTGDAADAGNSKPFEPLQVLERLGWQLRRCEPGTGEAPEVFYWKEKVVVLDPGQYDDEELAEAHVAAHLDLHHDAVSFDGGEWFTEAECRHANLLAEAWLGRFDPRFSDMIAY